MRVAVTMSWIAIGVAFGVIDTANATNEGDYQKSSAIEPKIKSDARIMGSDGRARTPNNMRIGLQDTRKNSDCLPTLQ